MVMIQSCESGRRWAPGTIIIGLLLACNSTDAVRTVDDSEESQQVALARDSTRAMQTDQLSYRVIASGNLLTITIRFTFRNPVEDTVYLLNCRGEWAITLSRYEDGQWRTIWGSVTPACASAPVVIPPGGAYSDTLWIAGGTPGGSVAPAFAVADLTGLYRLTWRGPVTGYFAQAQSGVDLADPLRTSNRFQLIAN